jgi:three-Cys-motif partner protein
MKIPWVIKEQTKVKHELLKQYIDPWMIILFNNQAKYKKQELLLYFDGFSGPGVYYTDNTRSITCPGSPIIVAEIANKHIMDRPRRQVTMFCIDNDKACVDMLSQELSKLNVYHQRWEVHHSEFDEKIHELLDEIENSPLYDQPMFFFIDPFGYTGYPMNTLKRVLKYQRVELFINFMIYDIIRFCEQGQFASKLIDQFGDDEFEQVKIIENAEEKQVYIINLYCESLKRLAKADYVMPFRVNTSGQKTRPRYYLIHVSKNLKALKVMKDTMGRISDVSYRFEAIGVKTDQMSLFEDPGKIGLRERIENFCTSLYPNDVEYSVIEDWAYANTNGIAGTIKEALISLEKEKKLKINRKRGQHLNTVTSGARILCSIQ